MSKFQIVKGITDNLEETPYIEGKVYFTYDNAESQNIVIYADIDGVRRKIKEGVQRDELDDYLLKTDIADWAKANTKPTYTANEVGALSTSHPTANITTEQITQWNNKSNFSGSYNDLTEKPTIPTKTSDLTNNSGFLIEETDPTVHILVLHEDENEELTTGEEDSISGYVNNNELVIIYYDGKPYFYDKNSDRGLYFNGINGNNLLRYYSTTKNKMVWSVAENSYIYEYDLPTNVSDFNNDAGYITQETDPTVPAWAKESTKPTYTAAEVGALPDTTVIPEDKVFIATYGTTTYADTLAAYNAGKLIFTVYNNGAANGKTIFPLTRKGSSFFQFEGRYLNGLSQKRICELSSSGWTTTSYFGDTVGRSVDIASGDGLIIRDSDDNSTMKASSLTFGTETNQYLANNGTWQTVPENVSDLTNDSGFQTSTEVNSAIATAIGNINQFNVAIVSTLPTENIDNHTIYFMSNGGSGDSIYDEWMYINDNWEKIGTTSIDLSGYMQISHPANGITSTDISNWNAKVSDTGKWNGVTLGSGRTDTSDDLWIPSKQNNSNDSGTAYWIKTTQELPTESAAESVQIPRYKKINNQWYLQSTTPSANDNSTKVATTAYVDAAIPQVYSSTNTTGYLTMATLPIYDGTVV